MASARLTAGGPTQEAPAAAGTKVEPLRACQVRRGSGERQRSHRRGGAGGLEPRDAGAGSWGGVRRACCAACEHADQQQLRGAASRRVRAARDAAQDAQPIGDDSAANERSTGVDDRREDVAAAPSLSSSSEASVERHDGTHHWRRAVRGRLASRDSGSQSAGPGGRTARRSGGRRGHHHGSVGSDDCPLSLRVVCRFLRSTGAAARLAPSRGETLTAI